MPRNPNHVLDPCAVRCAVVVVLCALGACSAPALTPQTWLGGGWVADYQQAERLAANSGRGVLFLFTNRDMTRPDPLRDFLADRASRGMAADYVPAVLFQHYEADRRYAAQFGVNRAPAVIARHPDGTFHALQGNLSQEQIAQFLSGVSPPGAVPTLNPHLARHQDYAWLRDWGAARSAGRETGRPVLVVLERWMSRDWETLRPMLERPEVYARFAGMIPCRPTTAWSSCARVAAELGVDKLPAIVIVKPDGPAHALELPTSFESIVRFADRVSRPAASRPG